MRGPLALLAVVLLAGCGSNGADVAQQDASVYVVGRDTANGVVCYKHQGSYGISCVKVRP